MPPILRHYIDNDTTEQPHFRHATEFDFDFRRRSLRHEPLLIFDILLP